MNRKNTLERHDTAPEEQPRGAASCDSDHFIALNWETHSSCAGQNHGKRAGCSRCRMNAEERSFRGGGRVAEALEAATEVLQM
jgi:hypothetical protein